MARGAFRRCRAVGVIHVAGQTIVLDASVSAVQDKTKLRMILNGGGRPAVARVTPVARRADVVGGMRRFRRRQVGVYMAIHAICGNARKLAFLLIHVAALTVGGSVLTDQRKPCQSVLIIKTERLPAFRFVAPGAIESKFGLVRVGVAIETLPLVDPENHAGMARAAVRRAMMSVECEVRIPVVLETDTCCRHLPTRGGVTHLAIDVGLTVRALSCHHRSVDLHVILFRGTTD